MRFLSKLTRRQPLIIDDDNSGPQRFCLDDDDEEDMSGQLGDSDFSLQNKQKPTLQRHLKLPALVFLNVSNSVGTGWKNFVHFFLVLSKFTNRLNDRLELRFA